jgi:hypothetical protein
MLTIHCHRIQIAAFQTYADYWIFPVDDTEGEGSETVIVSLLSTNNPRALIAPAPDSTATMIIYDNDLPLISLSQSTTAFSEDLGQNTITATLSSIHSSDVTVVLGVNVLSTATKGLDYELSSDTITIVAGTLTGNITLTAIQDELVEADETVIVEILDIVEGVEDGVQQVTSTIIDDDIANLKVRVDSHALEDANNGLITIYTDKKIDVPVNISYAVTGTASPGDDYTSIGTEVLLPAFADSVLIPVGILSDNLAEGIETVIVTLLSSDYDRVLISPSPDSIAVMNIFDADSAVFSFGRGFYGAEGGDDGYFTVYTSTPTASAVTVQVEISGTATETSDFQYISSFIVFPAFVDSMVIPLIVHDDELVEGTEHATICMLRTFSEFAHIDGGYGCGTIYIRDNDQARASLVAVRDAKEGAQSGIISIKLDKPVQHDVYVSVMMTGSATLPDDYEIVWDNIIPANTTHYVIHINAFEDYLIEGPETVNLVVRNFHNRNVMMEDDAPHHATISIIDESMAVFSIDVERHSGENLEPGLLKISSTHKFTEPVILDLSIAGTATMGEDFDSIRTQIVFPAYENETIVEINAIDDNLVEGSETILLTLINADHDWARIDISKSVAVMQVVDNDFTEVSVLPIADAVENGENGQFVFNIGSPVAYDITVHYSLSGDAVEGTDFKPIGRSISIPKGETTVDLVVMAIPDDLDEYRKWLIVSIDATTNNSVKIAGFPDNQALIAIIDSNPPVDISVSDVQGEEASGMLQFTVSLSKPSGKHVSVDYKTSELTAKAGFDYLDTIGTLVFEPGETQKQIGVTVIDNNYFEKDKTFELTLSNAEAGSIIQGTAVGTIINDDFGPTFALAFSNSSILENGGSSLLIATLDYVSDKEVSIELTMAGNATKQVDYTLSAEVITIAPGNLTGSILITSLSDDMVEGDEKVIITVVNSEYAYPASQNSVEMVIVDQDQVLTFGPLPLITYGSSDHTLVAETTSGLGVTYTSSNTSIAVVEGNKLKVVGAGSAVITAKQEGNGVFEAATPVSQTLTAAKAILKAKADDKQRFVNAENPPLTISFTGFVGSDQISDLDVLPVAQTDAVLTSPKGNYPIYVSGGSDNNYSFEYEAGNLLVVEGNSVDEVFGYGISIYPNPFTERIIVEASHQSGYEYTLTDLLGRKILSGKTDGEKTIIELAHLRSGAYILMMNDGQKQVSYRIVKN